MRLRFAGETNVGMKRAHNEDSFFLPESERLAIVADGMAGARVGRGREPHGRRDHRRVLPRHPGRAAADPGRSRWTAAPLRRESHGDRHQAGEPSRSKSRRKKVRSATAWAPTVVSTLFADGALIVGHVGDSPPVPAARRPLRADHEDHSLLKRLHQESNTCRRKRSRTSPTRTSSCARWA